MERHAKWMPLSRSLHGVGGYQSTFEIEPNMRIAQMIVSPVVQATFEVVEDLSETVRGTSGFGSTGA